MNLEKYFKYYFVKRFLSHFLRNDFSFIKSICKGSTDIKKDLPTSGTYIT